MEKYFIDKKEIETEEKFMDILEENVNNFAIETFDDFLDEKEPISILGIDYSVSKCLNDVDPIRYRCMLGDYQSDLLKDYVRYLKSYFSAKIKGKEFRIVKD